MTETVAACPHDRTRPRLEIPFDVKSDRATAFGRLVRCLDCGHGMVQPVPAPEEIAVHYDLDHYYTKSGSHMARVTPGLADRVVTRLAWTFEGAEEPVPDLIARLGPARGRMLDIGAGGGGLLLDMRGRGYEVTGVEPDARATAEAQGLTVLAGTAEDLPAGLPAGGFDVVTMTHVLEHCRAPGVALANVQRLLAPDGVFYVEVPNCGSRYFERYAQISEMPDVPRHLQFFTRASLTRMCAAAGFAPVAWRYRGFTRHFSASWCAWENGIHDRLVARNVPPGSPRRSLAGSLRLLAGTATAAADRKDDCLGLLARRAR